MNIKFSRWKDRVPHGFKFMRNAHLRDKRSWCLWVGKHCFLIEVYGLGPNP